MFKDIFVVNCPCCNAPVDLKERVKLIKAGTIDCDHCQARLTESIVSSLLATCILGVPSWLLLDRVLSSYKVDADVSYLLGMTLCLGIAKLSAPLCTLVRVET
ncbi:hypothetical protein GCM10011369_35280 [Neiella marina]|uniref:Uncharacterized protein n=1 Tax=Neiella marina TaxID=508461 RepID=A0A8J2UA75_9GAMM|nr:hypothetical protein GCM10011369_35280 [Neiella marina]